LRLIIIGDVFRFSPNGVLFGTVSAYRSIHSSTANVKKAKFYETFRRKNSWANGFNITDPALHSSKRRILNTAFTEKSIRSAEEFTIQHVDRWCELLCDDNDSWSKPRDMAERTDCLTFDLISDLAFGKSFNIKEPGDGNPFKEIPRTIATYMNFMFPVSDDQSKEMSKKLTISVF
jgi:cytochrome P450